MSAFYDLASLVVVPSGYKSGKIYAQKPLTTDGQLTFTRSTGATRVASNGLIEKVRTNLFLQSEAFNVTWGSSAGITLTGGQADPFGGSEAFLVSFGTSSGNSISQSVSVVSGVQYTMSAYIKGVDLTGLRMIVAGNASVSVMSQVVNGTWVRVKITGTAASTGSLTNQIVRSDNTLNQSFYIYGAQLETGDIATQYIPTTTAAVSVGPVASVPRLDYLNSSCPRLLLEGQRTNILPQSNFFAAADWVKLNASITSNSTTSPEGYANASKLTENSSTGFHTTYDSIGAAFSTVHTFSAFVKPSGRSIIYLRMENASTGGGLGITYFNVSTGQILTNASTSSSIEAYANGWYRVSITATTPAAASTLFVIGLADADNSRSYTGDGTSGAYIYGAQVEANATYPSSYIPTLGAAVTRGADAASKTGITSLIGQTEGTLYAEFEIDSNNTDGLNRILCVSDGSLQSRVLILANTNETIRFVVSIGGSSVVNITTQISVFGGRHKVAFAYKASDYVAYFDGVQVGTDTSISSVPASLTNIYVGTTEGGAAAAVLEGTIGQALLFKTRLTNAQLAELTTL